MNRSLEEINEGLYLPWRLDGFTSEQREEYAGLVDVFSQQKQAWLDSLESKGCEIIDGKAGKLVLAPSEVEEIRLDEYQFEADALRSFLKEMAISQGKKPTIGDRTTAMPKWIDQSGSKVLTRPEPFAKVVRIGEKTAYRGTTISTEEALNFLAQRKAKMLENISKSEANSQKKRAADQKAALGKIEQAFKTIRKVIELGYPTTVRFMSGRAFYCSVKGCFNYATVPSVCLIPVLADYKVVEAKERTKKGITVIKLEAGIELTIKSEDMAWQREIANH